MSGGHFDYDDYKLQSIADSIKNAIDMNNKEDDWGYSYDFSKETLDEFKKGIELIKNAQIYAHRIDYLLSGDDGEETFHERLKEDLDENN